MRLALLCLVGLLLRVSSGRWAGFERLIRLLLLSHVTDKGASPGSSPCSGGSVGSSPAVAGISADHCRNCRQQTRRMHASNGICCRSRTRHVVRQGSGRQHAIPLFVALCGNVEYMYVYYVVMYLKVQLYMFVHHHIQCAHALAECLMFPL